MADSHRLPGTHPTLQLTQWRLSQAAYRKETKKGLDQKSLHPRRCIVHRGGGTATMLKLMPRTGFLTRYVPPGSVMLSGETTACTESKTQTKPQVE